MVDGKQCSATIKHANCDLLIYGNICASCNDFRDVLRALFSKHRNRSWSNMPSIYTNTRFLRTPQKSVRTISLRKAIHIKNRQLKQLKIRLNNILDNDGVVVTDDLRCDIEKVVESHHVLEEDEFKRVFWEQQVAS